MPPLLEDPRIRQTWNQISHNAESATENAAANIWTFTHSYVSPCLSSISSSFDQCTGTCFPDREERARRLRERGRTRGRAEFSFDFYDDWDEEDEASGGGGILGWGNDELDRLLAGSGSHGGHEQPSGRKRGMSYGTRAPGRRKTIDGRPDPTIIPSTNPLGFLGRLPFKIGSTLRYKPSAADLQDHPGRLSSEIAQGEEIEPLIDEGNEDILKSPTRKRSSTTSSGETTNSFRSRGDLFPSDEEDAVPLDDEFAMVLERRNTSQGTDDRSSGRTRSSKGKRPARSRRISRTLSGQTQDSVRPSRRGTRDSSASSPYTLSTPEADEIEVPDALQLQAEEDRIKSEEEGTVERKRLAATKLAFERGFNIQEEMFDKSGSEVEANAAIKDAAADETPLVAHMPKDSTGEETPVLGSFKDEFVPARLPNF